MYLYYALYGGGLSIQVLYHNREIAQSLTKTEPLFPNLQPVVSVFQFIPMAVLYGVFLYMGISSLKGMQLVNRVLILFMPMKYQPDYSFLRHVRIQRVHFFTVIQMACLALLWVIKTIKAISIAFPIMVSTFNMVVLCSWS